MFEQSLVESTGRIRTRSRRYAVPSFLLETALVTTLVLLPYLYPAALPRNSLTTPLIAPPPPPAAPAPEPTTAPAARPQTLNVYAPSRIPNSIQPIVDAPPGPIVPGTAFLGVPGLSAAPLFPAAPPPAPPARAAKPAGPLRISAGVAQGQLIVPIQPRYPAIAQQARVQGTVVVSALIGTDGRIASLHVLSGPALLVPAATEAIQRARYRPWTLNGQPVEVETTINAVFSLGSN
ncbi:MAG: energy transducer TonB [Acidobacteriaceae bacterium]